MRSQHCIQSLRASAGLATLALGTLGLLLAAAPAAAVQIRVDWESTDGTGTVSGSFGIFKVTAAGQEFSLPSDGSITAATTGFLNEGFLNTTYVLDQSGGDLRFRFDSLAPIQGQLVDIASDRLWGSVPCGFGGSCIFASPPPFGQRLGFLLSYKAIGIRVHSFEQRFVFDFVGSKSSITVFVGLGECGVRGALFA